MPSSNTQTKNTDLFNNSVPEVKTVEEVQQKDVPQTQAAVQQNVNNPSLVFLQDNMLPIAGVLIGILLVLLCILLFNNRPKKKKELRISQIVSTKKIKPTKVKNTLATPENVNQCIKMFLENTKNINKE